MRGALLQLRWELLDGDEVMLYLSSPTRRDSDGDGFDDNVEVRAGSDPADPDSMPAAEPIPTLTTALVGSLAMALVLIQFLFSFRREVRR